MTTDPNSRSLPLNNMTMPAIPIVQEFSNASMDGEKWDLGWLASVFRPRAPLMVGTALSTALFAGGILWLSATLRPPIYSGRFQILVEPVTAEEKQARSSTQAQGTDVQQNILGINVEQSSLDYETQIRILKSLKLINPIVQRLKPNYPTLTYEELTGNLNIQRITSLTLDKREQGTKLIEVSYVDPDPQKVQTILSELSQAYLNYSLKERQSSIRQGIKFIGGQLPQLEQRVDTLQRQIQGLREQYTLVDPALEGQQLSAISGNLDQQRSATQTQLAETAARWERLRQQLQAANLTSVLGEAPYYQALLAQYQEVEGKLAIESARLTPENPALQALLDKRQSLQRLLQQEANQVLSKAGDQIQIAEARNQAIIQAQANVRQQIRQLPSVARQYADLQRELLLATDSLNKFLSRQEALQIDAAQQEIPWELISPPALLRDAKGAPQNMAAVPKLRLLLLIAVLSILLGVGIGFLVEISQDVVRSTDEIKRSTRLPLLGVVPLGDAQTVAAATARHQDRQSAQTATPDRDPPALTGTVESGSGQNGYVGSVPSSSRRFLYNDSPFAESFRSLYKNIRLIKGWDTPLRSLTISSPEAGDGKTTIAVNLAMVAAAMGQRVLLVDADLRHPQVHHLMKLSNQHGLSNILTSNQDIQMLLQQLSREERLTVLTAGQIPVDPVSALSSEKMRLLMEGFQMVFDLVIYDTPPLVGLADSSVIANHTDGLAMVVRLGKTKLATIKYALEELKLQSTPILGVIANGSRETISVLNHYSYRPKGEPVMSQ